jgi:hypothetical protein
MVKLGSEEQRSRAQLAARGEREERAKIVTAAGGASTLNVNEPFDRAWRRVGLALDRVGFTVEDRDRSKGIYFVRYVDPTKDGGTIVLLSACANGIGPGFGEAISQHPAISTVWHWVGTGETTPTGGPMVARVLGVLQRKRVVLVTPNLPEAEVRRMGFDYAPTPEAALSALGLEHPEAGVLVFPAGSAINPLPVAVTVQG